MNPRTVIDRTGRGISYRSVLPGTDPAIPNDLRLPERYRLKVTSASDDQILSAIGALIHAYTDSLRNGTDHTLRSSRSPYDVFLQKNRISAEPEKGETRALKVAGVADAEQRIVFSRFLFVRRDDSLFAMFWFVPNES